MQSIASREELRRLLSKWRNAGRRIALVPTMGNLHAGHLSLVRAVRRHADRCVVSIFVNPTQFGEGEDFDKYPRTLARDLEMLKAEGCDLAFTPATDAIYPFGLEQAVMIRAAPELAGRLEGRSRPGHFDGVVTVVARLFALVQPDVAVFGEKDYQQLLVVRRMSKDMGFDIDIVGAETVRSGSGLALSSRNAFLDDEQTRAALALNRVLRETAEKAGRDGPAFDVLEKSATGELEAAGLRVDYVAIRSADDLTAIEAGDGPLRILAAVWCGATRLIDNMPIRGGS